MFTELPAKFYVQIPGFLVKF